MIKRDRAGTLLEHYIKDNDFPSQSKLPAERQLCDELGISRGELRKALSLLESEGKLWRHVGRGTFIGARPIDRMDEIAALSNHTNPAEMTQARLLLEPAICRISAIEATANDIERMRLCSKRKDAALDWHTYEQWDGRFHQAVATGAHNTLLLTLFNALNTIREATEWSRIRKSRQTNANRNRASKEHYAIIDAISNRDPDQAEAAMHHHLASVHKAHFPPT